MISTRFVYFPYLPGNFSELPNQQFPCLWMDSTGCWTSCMLAELMPMEEVHVFLPNMHILSTQVVIPKKQHKHLARILPFVCEEKFACDPEELHFATGAIDGESIAIRAVAKNLLDTLLNKLAQQQIHPLGVYSDAEPFIDNGHTQLWMLSSCWVLVIGQRTVTLHHQAAEQLTRVLEEQIPLDQSPPRKLTIYYLPPSARVTQLLIEDLRLRDFVVTEAPLPLEHHDCLGDFLLPLCAALGTEVIPANYPNLLCGSYTPIRANPQRRNWVPYAWAAAICLGLNLLYLLASAVYFDQRAHQLRAGSEQLYRQYFPQDNKLVNIRTQTQAHLDKSRQGTDDGFLALLGRLLPSWNTHQGDLQLQSLRYHSQRRELLLDFESKTIGQLDQLQQSLGPQAELLSANETTDGRARGRIQLQGIVK